MNKAVVGVGDMESAGIINTKEYSCRPVVCLKSGVELTQNADGTIAIGNVK